jgi:hypothetical protein
MRRAPAERLQPRSRHAWRAEPEAARPARDLARDCDPGVRRLAQRAKQHPQLLLGEPGHTLKTECGLVFFPFTSRAGPTGDPGGGRKR